jgi:hypothetical protein
VGVVYIGERSTGKTSLMMELAASVSDCVEVSISTYNQLRGVLYDPIRGVLPTSAQSASTYDNQLDVKVRLPAGKATVLVNWVDTPGEVWRQQWQRDNPALWKKVLDAVGKSEGVVLILPPYGEIIGADGNPDDFPTLQQWCNRFDRWVDFFQSSCPRLRHLLICLNKADLFCEFRQEGQILGYNPNSNGLNWYQRHNYTVDRYFRAVRPQLKQLNRSMNGLSVRCFITTIHDRPLLELPWVYLGTYLAKPLD